MAWANAGRKAVTGASGVTSLGVTHNSSAAGNHMICGVSAWDGMTAPTSVGVSDNINGAYASGGFRATGKTAVAGTFFENGTGGNLTVTATPAGGGSGSYDIGIFTDEFSGGAASSSLSGTGTSGAGTSATPATGNATPADANCLAIGVLDFDSFSTIEVNGAGEGFTLSNENEGAAQPGSMVWKLLSGTPSTGHSWNCGASAEYAAVIFFLRPAAGGGQTVEIGQAQETDTAFSVGRAKSRAVGLNTESDSAFAVGRAKRLALGLVSEVATAFSLGRAKRRAVGLAQETDAALSARPNKARLVGLASETSSAFSFARLKARILGLAQEFDSALPTEGGAASAETEDDRIGFGFGFF